MTRQLLVLRHAKSSWSDASLNDFERPLNSRGKADAPRMGRLLADQALVPDLIITSAARRALRTAEEAADASGYAGKLIATRELYLAAPEDYILQLQELGGSNKLVMVVGHNPGIEDLLEELTGTWQQMPTAALAYLELDIDDWSDLRPDSAARLLEVWRPKEL